MLAPVVRALDYAVEKSGNFNPEVCVYWANFLILSIFLHCRVVNKSVFPKRFLHNYTKVMLLHRVIEKFILFSYTFLDFIDYDFHFNKTDN